MAQAVYRAGLLKVCIFLFVCYAELNMSGANDQIKDLLHDQLLRAKADLTKTIIFNPRKKRDSKSLNVTWNNTWVEAIENARGVTVEQIYSNKNTFSNLFIISGETVQTLNGEEISSFRLVPVSTLHDSQQIVFVKGIEWENILFLLLGLKNDHCQLYTASSKMDFTLRQTISNTDNPVDAEFFIQNNKLFLVIIFNRHYVEEAPLLIYQWHGTHFDEENRHIITTGAVSVTSFNNRDSVIIVIGQQNTNEKVQVSSQVWERKSNGVLEKIQFLPTHRPVSIKHFIEKNENFLLVLEENVGSTVYWWEGEEFVVWLPLPEIKGHCSVSFGYINNETLIVLSKENIVQMYCLQWNEFQLRGEITFNGSVVSLALHKGNKTLLVAAIKDSQCLRLHVTDLLIGPTNSADLILSPETDPFKQGMKQLEYRISSVDGQLRRLRNMLPTLLYTNKHEDIRGVSVRGGTHQVKVDKGDCSTYVLSGNEHLINKNDLYVFKADSLLNKVKGFMHSIPHKLTSNKTIIIDSNMRIANATINSIKVNTINNRPAIKVLNYDKYISLSRNQTIHTEMRTKSIKANWLLAKSVLDKITDNLILKSGTIEGMITTSYLKCENIHLVGKTTINNVNVSTLVHKHGNSIINGEIHVRSADIEILHVRDINKVNASEVLERIQNKKGLERVTNLKLQNNTTIHNLHVHQINSISINSLFENLFINNTRNIIKGDMHYIHGVAAKNLEATEVNELVVRDMLTLTTDQHVRSRLAAEKISLAPRRKHQDYRKDTKNPIMKRETKSKNTRNHKIFTKKVMVKGNLQAKKVVFVNSSVTIMNQTIPMNSLHAIFWTHSSDQAIKVPVVVHSETTMTGNLDVETINKKNLSNLVECNQAHHLHTNLIVENITVNGPITVNRLINNSIDFNQLKNSVVTKMGRQTVTGNKVFLGCLSVSNVTVSVINSILTDNMIPKTTPGEMSTVKNQWSNLSVGNLVITEDLNPVTVNGYNLKGRFNSTILKSDMNFKNINFANVSVSSLIVEKVNNTDVNRFLHAFKDTKGKLNYQLVHLNGNLSIDKIKSLETINGIHLKSHLPLVVNGSQDTVIRGKKTFPSQVIVEGQVNMKTLNGMSMQDLYGQTLSKITDQNISGHYFFNDCNVNSLDTTFIDGINTNHLIYTVQPVIEIRSNLNISSFMLKGNMKTNELLNRCYLPKMEENIVTWRQAEKWFAVHIDGDIILNKNSVGVLQNIFQSAVRINGKQVISGHVIFTNDVIFENIQAQQFINGANMSSIMEDALMKNKHGQVIGGINIFENDVYCKNIMATKNADFKEVSGQNLFQLSGKLIFNSKDHNITGQKTFVNGFKAFHFHSQGGINGITSKTLVTPNTDQVLPDTVFENLEVTHALHVDYINSINVNEFLNQRIKLKSDTTMPQIIRGNIMFNKNVLVHGNMSIKQINAIKPDDVVYTDKTSITTASQNITGCKTFKEYISIKGNIDIEKLNENNIKALHELSWLAYSNATIHSNIVFEKEVTLDNVFGETYYIKDKHMNHLYNISGKR